MLPTVIILKLSYFRKNDSWKREVLQIFGLGDQEIDSWFTNHEPLINSEQMHIRLEQPPKNIETKLPNDEEIRP